MCFLHLLLAVVHDSYLCTAMFAIPCVKCLALHWLILKDRKEKKKEEEEAKKEEEKKKKEKEEGEGRKRRRKESN